MRKILLLLLLPLLLLSCKDDDPCAGLTIDVLTQMLYIEIIDTDGNNLIQNGTYPLDEIFIERNATRFPAIIYTEEASFVDTALQYKIEIGLVGDLNEANLWSIELNGQEIDTLRMELSILEQGCSGTFYAIDAIEYNNQALPVQDLGENRYQIQVVK